MDFVLSEGPFLFVAYSAVIPSEGVAVGLIRCINPGTKSEAELTVRLARLLWRGNLNDRTSNDEELLLCQSNGRYAHADAITTLTTLTAGGVPYLVSGGRDGNV